MISGSISSSICYAPNHDRISLSPYLRRKRVNKRFLLDEVEHRAWTGFWRRTINAIPSPTMVSRLCKGENTRRYPRWSVFRNNEANGRRSNFETGKRRGTRPSVLESVGNASSWWSRIIEGRWLRLVNSQHKYPSAISFVGVHYGGLNARTCTVYYPDKFCDAIRLLPLFDVSRWTLFLSRSIFLSFVVSFDSSSILAIGKKVYFSYFALFHNRNDWIENWSIQMQLYIIFIACNWSLQML